MNHGVPALVCALLLAACDSGHAPPPAPTAPVDTLLAVNGTHLFVHREGRGQPVLVIHGGPLLDHGYMLDALRPLSDAFDLVFYDQRLSGRSDPAVDSASVTLANFAEDVEAIRQALGLGRIHVLGHSWGGLIAMEYATRHPDALRTLVLADPMPPTAALWQEGEAALAASLEPQDTAGMGELRASPEIAANRPDALEQLLRLSFRSQFHDPALARTLDFHITDDYGERSRQFAYLVPDLTSFDLTAALHEVESPVLLVYGADEVGVQPGIAALREAIPHLAVEPIRDAGHFPFVEQPEATLRIIRAFLTTARGR